MGVALELVRVVDTNPQELASAVQGVNSLYHSLKTAVLE